MPSKNDRVVIIILTIDTLVKSASLLSDLSLIRISRLMWQLLYICKMQTSNPTKTMLMIGIMTAALPSGVNPIYGFVEFL
jgi:hypothetical protein